MNSAAPSQMLALEHLITLKKIICWWFTRTQIKHKLDFSNIKKLAREINESCPHYIHNDPDSSFTFWSPSFTKGSISLLWWSLLSEKATGLGATCAKCLKQETRCSISSWNKTEHWMNTELKLMYKSCHWSQQCAQRRKGQSLKQILPCCLIEQQHRHITTCILLAKGQM